MNEQDFVDLAWEELRKECASDPKRLVMVTHDDVVAAMQRVWEALGNPPRKFVLLKAA